MNVLYVFVGVAIVWLIAASWYVVVPWWHVDFLLHATLAYSPSPVNAITLIATADRECPYKGASLGRILPLALGHTPHCYVAVVVTVAVVVVVFNLAICGGTCKYKCVQ